MISSAWFIQTRPRSNSSSFQTIKAEGESHFKKKKPYQNYSRLICAKSKTGGLLPLITEKKGKLAIDTWEPILGVAHDKKIAEVLASHKIIGEKTSEVKTKITEVTGSDKAIAERDTRIVELIPAAGQ